MSFALPDLIIFKKCLSETMQFEEQQRRVAAAIIEHKVKEIAHSCGMTVSECIWNLDQGMDHSGPHRMDIYGNEKVEKIYLTDYELADYCTGWNTRNTDARFQMALNKLLGNEISS